MTLMEKFEAAPQVIFVLPHMAKMYVGANGWIPICQYPRRFKVEKGEIGMNADVSRSGAIRSVVRRVFLA